MWHEYTYACVCVGVGVIWCGWIYINSIYVLLFSTDRVWIVLKYWKVLFKYAICVVAYCKKIGRIGFACVHYIKCVCFGC